MAPIRHSHNGATDWLQVANRLEELYQGNFLDEDDYDGTTSTQKTAAIKAIFGSEGGNPSVAIPHIISYLSNNDATRDPHWAKRFKLIQAYLAETHRQMVTGSLGFGNPKLRAALEDARVMVKVHRDIGKTSKENTPWTEGILRGQITQERILTYPKAFPPPDPDRSKSRYRPVKPTPRPDDRNTSLWTTSFHLVPYSGGANSPPRSNEHRLTEVDGYVESENKFFHVATKSALSGNPVDNSRWRNVRFGLENTEYERCIKSGLEWTCLNAPPPHSNTPNGPRGRDNPDGTKGATFYVRRGWQRGALQHCLNMFTSHENRAINTPWRRAVLPYESPLPLPKDVAFVPRVVDPRLIIDGRQKDPFSWLQLMSQYTQTIDFLAECQRKRYNNQVWANFSAPALPANFRGPHIYRGLSVYDQHWLRIGQDLEKLESRLHNAWGAAPRPLLRAILRDIDAGRQADRGPLAISDGQDDDEVLERKRYWRRDIKRRPAIDTQEDKVDDGSYQLVDEFDIAWLRYLCEPSRTIDMCDPSKLPSSNLAILFDAKLQSYFRALAESGAPDTSGLPMWHENREDIRVALAGYRPNSVKKVVAYINGCDENDVKDSGHARPNLDHPNGSYQFTLDEAEFLCMQLEGAGRCVFTPSRNGEPSTVDRPKYTVHPEDRITWRYLDADQFKEESAEYLREMLEHYHNSYDSWAAHKPDRPSFSRELEYMLDHVGPDFTPELERIETQDPRTPDGGVSAERLPFIRRYLVPEGMCRYGHLDLDSVALERASPCWDDIAPWEAAGDFVFKYQAQRKAQEETTGMSVFYSHEPYRPQTPERTAQFLRNLAYRMGRTMRHVDQIKERLQYLDNTSPPSLAPKPPLDLSPELKTPRPEDQPSGNSGNTSAVAAEKWWHAVSAKDQDLAIKSWTTAVEDGSGEVALLPPDISEVLAKADPSDSFRNKLKEQDAFTEIREGIIDDCVRNLPTMYPVRLSGFKDQENKEFQGFERPNLFEWATKDQRRYQAHHTREHFFNMQRWPPCRIPPERLEGIRERKDEVLRHDPRQDDQAYGILTHRLPVGKEKPLYARPIVAHQPLGGDDLYDSVSTGYRPIRQTQPHPEPPQHDYSIFRTLASGGGNLNNLGNLGNLGNGGNGNNGNNGGGTGIAGGGDDSGGDNHSNNNNDNGGGGGNNSNNHSNNNNNGSDRMDRPTKMSKRTIKKPKSKLRPVGLVPYRRSNTKFAPGPAVFPMGDTLLQKMWVSHELTNALYPKLPLYKERLLGLPKLWHKITDAKPPLIPLVPEVSRANLPRSNPNKRKMPIEFLNSEASTKKFRSDVAIGLQPGGSGGQFGAGMVEVVDADPKPVPDPALASSRPVSRAAQTPPGAKPQPPTTPQNSRAVPVSTAPAVNEVEEVEEDEDEDEEEEEEDGPYIVNSSGERVQLTHDNTTASASTTPPKTPAPSKPGQEQVLYLPTPSTAEIRVSERSMPPQPPGKSPSVGAGRGSTGPYNMGRTSRGASAPAIPPIPSYTDVADVDSYVRYKKDFPKGFNTLDKDIRTPYLATSGLIALEHSINRQLRRYGVKTDKNELAEFLESAECACLRPYKDLKQNNFSANCLAHLLQVFGDKRGLKLQLGLIHDDYTGTRGQYHFGETPNDQHAHFAAFLIGSPHNGEPDVHVVWVRLTVDPSPFKPSVFNPYNRLPYNTYKGVVSR